MKEMIQLLASESLFLTWPNVLEARGYVVKMDPLCSETVSGGTVTSESAFIHVLAYSSKMHHPGLPDNYRGKAIFFLEIDAWRSKSSRPLAKRIAAQLIELGACEAKRILAE